MLPTKLYFGNCSHFLEPEKNVWLSISRLYKRGIFARRAMVDQARRATATGEKLNILEYLTLKDCLFYLNGIFLFRKLCVFASCNHINNGIFLFSCLAMES